MSTEIYKYIDEKLNNNKIIILDGANGSELEKRGAKMDRAGWCGPASITHPHILENIPILSNDESEATPFFPAIWM